MEVWSGKTDIYIYKVKTNKCPFGKNNFDQIDTKWKLKIKEREKTIYLVLC